MYLQERGKRTFVPVTREYQRLKHRKSWYSMVNIMVMLVIVVALVFVLLVILGKTSAL